jgi:hypothetical protein
MDLTKAVKDDKFMTRIGEVITYDIRSENDIYPNLLIDSVGNSTSRTDDGRYSVDGFGGNLDIVKAVKETSSPTWDEVLSTASASATIEIKDEDIATIENLHDRLLPKLDINDPRMVLSRELTGRMSKALNVEDNLTDSSSDKINNKIDEVRDMLLAKNKAYGDAALAPVGIFNKNTSSDSIRARIDDKLARIKNSGINDDTEDTVQDLCGYFILLMIANDQ